MRQDPGDLRKENDSAQPPRYDHGNLIRHFVVRDAFVGELVNSDDVQELFKRWAE